jgi:hypothetical protein
MAENHELTFGRRRDEGAGVSLAHPAYNRAAIATADSALMAAEIRNL